ncbi:hypothetical protein LEMLEM_LOCUS27303 [Lemmus lemmus]
MCVSSKPQLLRRGAQALPDRLHTPASPRTGEGISLQSLPDAAPEGGDRPRALPVRAPDQDLVPESAHEVEKRPQVAQHQDPLGWHLGHSRRTAWPAQWRPSRALVPPKQELEPGGGGGHEHRRGIRGYGRVPRLQPTKNPIYSTPTLSIRNKYREGGLGKPYL